MPEKKPEWAVNLSTALKSWIPANGYRTSTELEEVLDISKRAWKSIHAGEAVVNDKSLYARIHLWTGLGEADPRNIPDLRIRIPGRGEIFKKRSLSEEEYQKWLKSPKTQALLAKRDERFKREVIMEQTEPTQPETVGSSLGSFIDGLVNRGAGQVAKLLLEHQTEVIAPRISALENRMSVLEDAITRLVKQPQTPTRLSRVANNNDINQLVTRLRKLLDDYMSGASKDRDSLMQNNGQALMNLEVLLYPLNDSPRTPLRFARGFIFQYDL